MNPWDILGIEETDDRKTVKRAFAKKVKTVRPEDDQKEYQDLREAYEHILERIEAKQDTSVFGNQGEAWQTEVADNEVVKEAEPLIQETTTQKEQAEPPIASPDEVQDSPPESAEPLTDTVPQEPRPEAANWHLDEDHVEVDEDGFIETTVDNLADIYVDSLLTTLNEDKEDEAIALFEEHTQSELWEEEEFRHCYEHFLLASILEIPWSPAPIQFISTVIRFFDWRLETAPPEMRFHFFELEGRFTGPISICNDINKVLRKKKINPFNPTERAIKALFGPCRPFLFRWIYAVLPIFFNIYHIRMLVAQAPPDLTDSLREKESFKWWTAYFKNRSKRVFKIRSILLGIALAFGPYYAFGTPLKLVWVGLGVVVSFFGDRLFQVVFKPFLVKGADFDFKPIRDDL